MYIKGRNRGEGVNKRAIHYYYNKQRGYSLLEIILVLAFIGVVMATAATWLRKRVDEAARQAVADAVAQEVSGVLQFIHSDTLLVTINNQTRKLANPLYQSVDDPVYGDDNLSFAPAPLGIANNPLFQLHAGAATGLDAAGANVSLWLARVWSTSLASPLNAPLPPGIHSHPLRWSQAVWGQNSARTSFTDSGCQNAIGVGAVLFHQSFLSCDENPVLVNSALSIVRIDLISSKGATSRDGATRPQDVSVGIDRVDVYVQFTPADGNAAGIMQVISPLISALRTKKLSPDADAIWLVSRAAADPADQWDFVTKTGAPYRAVSPDELIGFSEIPAYLGRLGNNRIYAVRLSFNGNSDYLRTDGVNAATRLCWNTAAGTAGPCLTSASQDSLVLKQRHNPQEFASLQASGVISTASHTGADGNTVVDEYYTAPRISYAAFSNDGGLPAVYRNPAVPGDLCTAVGCGQPGPGVDAVTLPANGAIAVPLQRCPQAQRGDGQAVTLHPRLSVSVSSAIAGIRKDATGTVLAAQGGTYLDSQERNMTQMSGSDVSINRLGGVIFQIIQHADSQNWRIGAMVAAEDTGIIGHAWQYYNPPWLSVMVTSWCSSVAQP